MAKRITQQTFDGVVKENIEEFMMEPEEAVNDAVKQFQAQGVELGNIVRDLYVRHATGDGPVTHPVLDALTTLAELCRSNDSDLEAVKNALRLLRKECDIDLSHRCLAGTNNAFTVLYDALLKYLNDRDTLVQTLSTLGALCTGQPDVVELRAIIKFTAMLTEHRDDKRVIDALVKLIRLTCIMHETNRQGYVEQGLIPGLVSLLEKHVDSASLVKEVCFALRVLTFDDDIRVPFGKAHDHAKIIVTETDALKTITNACREYTSNVSVLGELFSTLGKLAVRNEFCQEIVDLGGLGLLLHAMEDNIENQSIVKQSFGVLRAIAGNDNVKVAIIAEGGAQMIIDAMNRHLANPQVCENGCAALGNLSLRNPKHCETIMAAQGHQVILQAMKVHPKVDTVQKQGCMAMRNLVARTREYCDMVLELGAEDLIRLAQQQHSSCEDEAKSALRDLGCKVELVERWKGESAGIQQ